MKQGFTKNCIAVSFLSVMVFSQQSNGIKVDYNSKSEVGVEFSENRLPDLLKEAKVLLSDAFISDVMNDTLEVVYNLNRIFDLLSEADQYGEMDDEDKDEQSSTDD